MKPPQIKLESVFYYVVIVFASIILSGCSKDLTVQSNPVYVPIPQNLLTEPCKAVEAGETLSTLAKGYVANTGCIGEYKVRITKLREWNDEQSKIYTPFPK